MCGIAGILGVAIPAEERLRYLKAMLLRLRHRGPDESGTYADEAAAIGTARLNIVDPVGGKQPFVHESGRYVIVFNGEIYNYPEIRADLVKEGCRFVTNSDTEVLLNAWVVWKEECLNRLNGGFAFCVYDSLSGEAIIARDRFGKRPLYYIRDGRGFVFASEMKAFLAYDRFDFAFCSDSLASIARTWTPIGAQTPFRGISQLPPGCCLRLARGEVRIRDYAPLQLQRPAGGPGAREWPVLLKERLQRSVELRLRCDTEAAVYLSGGLDSAIVALLMTERAGGPVKSFSVGFEDPDFDESEDQALLASELGTLHTTVEIGSSDIVDNFPEAVWHAEVPTFRTAFVPMFLLSREVKRHGIKVVLTGEGADEAFLGYDLFKEAMLRAEWSDLDPQARAERLNGLYPYLPQFSTGNSATLYGLFSRFVADPDSDFFSHDLRFHNSRQSLRLLRDKTRDGLEALSQAVRSDRHFRSYDLTRRAQWLEYRTLLSGYLLSTQGDRMSLANSVENRCPFLDPEVVEVALASNPGTYDGVNEKKLLKQAFRDRLPGRILTKPKQPYRAPDASVFLEARPDYLDLLLSRAELAKIDVIDPEFCGRFVEKIRSKTPDQITQSENQTFIFLLSLACIQRQFVEQAAV